MAAARQPARRPLARGPGVADAQCLWAASAALDPPPDPAALWDLDGWADDARALRAELAGLLPRFEGGDTGALGVGFVVSAAVLRHFQRDPLLPASCCPPSWPGDDLRRDYERYDAAYRAVWTDWFRRQR